MADLERVVDIIFNGVDNIGPGFDQAAKTINQATGEIANIAAPLADVTKSLLLAETAILGVGAALLKVGLEEAAKFETAFREISTLIQDPTANLEDFQAQILDYSRTSTQELETITDSVYAFISATGDWESSLTNLGEAERLAIAGNADLGATVTLLAQILNTYGDDVITAADASDALFTIVRTGVTDLTQLTQQFGVLLSPAEALGISIEELGAALATVTAQGVTGGQAFTSLQAALTALIRPSAQAADLADTLGIEFSAAAVQSQGFETVMRNVVDATGGNVEQLSVLFGSVEALRAVLALTSKDLVAFGDNLLAQENNAGAAAEAFDKMANTAELAAQQLANATRAALIDFAGPIENEYADILTALSEIFTAIGQEFKPGGNLNEITVLLEEFAESLADVLRGVVRALPDALDQLDLTPFTEGLEAIAEVFGGLDLTDPDELAQVLQSLIDGFGTLSQFSAGVIDFFGGLGDVVGPLARGFSDLDSDTAALIGSLGGLAVVVVPLAGAIGTLATAVRSIATLGGLATALLGSAGAAALAGSATAIAGIATAIGTLTFAMSQITGLDETLNDILAPDWLFGEGATVGTAIADLAESLGLLGGEADNVTDAAGQISGALNDTETAAAGASEGLQEPVDTAGNLSDGLFNASQTIGLFSGELTNVAEAGDDLTESQKRVAPAIVKTTEASEAAAEELRKQEEATQKLQLAYAELASEEYIARLETTSEIEIATLEAQATRVQAALETISTIATSTGDVISGLFQITENPEWDRFGFEIERQLDQEREIRQRAADDAHDLAQAEVDLLRERERSVRRGEALITINGDNLEADLRALMDAVIRSIHVTGTQEGVEQLLAIP